MSYEIYDPKEEWSQSDPSVKMCHEHDRTLVSYWESECPLCRAESRIKELEGIVSLCYDTIGNMKDSELQGRPK